MIKNRQTFLLLSLQIALLFLYGCGSSSEESSQIPSETEVVIQGNTQGKEVIQTLAINNCDGKSDLSRIEEYAQSVDVTISTEIAATIGASAEIISAEVQAAVGAGTTQSGSRSMSIQLTAPPQTHMQFQLIWTGNEQIGVVQNLRGSHIPIAFQGFIPTDVRIKSQNDIGCPGTDTVHDVVGSEPTTSSSATRPANVSISDGGNFSPSSGWIWVCGGDFDAILPNGNTVTLHDWAEPSLIIILESDSQISLDAPWGGYCEPSTQNDLSTTVQKFLDNGFQRGCENDNGCSSINVKRLDPNGNIVDDYWVQHPTTEPASQGRSEIVEQGGVLPYETLSFDFTLNTGEIIVGQSYGFQENTGGCQAFLVKGPGQFLFTITDGAWFRYKNIASDDEAELLLQKQKDDLVNASNSQCPYDEIQVSKLP